MNKGLLIELHDKLKQHLFRQTGDKTYLKDYLEEYHNLMDTFIKEYPYGMRNQAETAISEMYHDCSGSISLCKNNNKYYEGIRAEYLEKCLMVFHRWLDYEEVPYYYKLWRKDGKPYIVKFSLIKDENISQYFNIPKNFKKEHLLEQIKEWEEKSRNKPEYKKYVNELKYLFNNFEKLIKNERA